MISSKSNPIIKNARSLRQGRTRKESGLFLIEGLHPVGAALEAGWDLEALLYSAEILASPFGRELVQAYAGRKEEVSDSVLASVAAKEHPQGILAIGRHVPTAVADIAPGGCMAALENAQDPGNVGTILRTLDAVGGKALFLLGGGVDAFHPAAIRAAMGATFVVPVVECAVADFLEWRASHGVFLLGSSSKAQVPYRMATPREPWILALGNEQKGLSDELKSSCDAVVSLPMQGRASSLNLAVAAGILLYWYYG